ncbi:alpha/beta fold hydrolase [Achromobacter sp. GG226]|uniref:alpha/beta fold hydrolase n=1 Tax=Verticiella alkaliphila TaxID=2779529 RepID=UPI001C0BCBD3|nr:alpha/beta fold hydrolase [Verticiella sp. GG226]MBU4612745.1 alpha/beta fold hydrolase [Verticiella sp. GG226]
MPHDPPAVRGQEAPAAPQPSGPPAATVEPLASRHGLTPGGTGYTVTGQGEPVVLIHGVGMRRGIWAPQVSGLARTCQVITYDMLGHGNSRLPSPAPRLADYAVQLAELLTHLGIDQANVAGHSMGALVALEFALTHPERTRRVAALNAVYARTDEQRAAVMGRATALQGAEASANIASTLARWFGEPTPPGLAAHARLAGEYLATVDPIGYARTYQLFAQADAAHVGRLGRLAPPTLFLTGAEDANSSPAMSAAMAQEVPASELVVLPGARHMMTLTHAQRVNEVLLAWLDREGPPGMA